MARHRQVWALHRQGWPGHAIARHLGIARSTAYRCLRGETFPERKGRSDAGHSLIDPWAPFVIERWTSGHRNGRRLFGELRQRGYRGSYPTLARYLQRLPTARGAAPADRRPTIRRGPALAAAPRRVVTPRTAAWAVLSRAEKRSRYGRALLAALGARMPAF